jgi:alpha-beta hydrolase superfamily lysophospholipase
VDHATTKRELLMRVTSLRVMPQGGSLAYADIVVQFHRGRGDHLMDRYQKAGVCDISFDFYDGGRHEMLNEINRAEVQRNLLTWISAVLPM